MGSATTYLGFNQSSKDLALKTLDLIDTGVDDPENKTPFMGLTLKSGSYVISKGLRGSSGFTKSDKEKLSEVIDFLYHDLHEGVMVSTVESWKKGIGFEWRVIHEGDKEITHLDILGEIPEVAEKIISETRELQANDPDKDKDEVDFYFDIPVKIFQHFTTYHYADSPDGDYTRLNGPTVPVKKPWWKFF